MEQKSRGGSENYEKRYYEHGGLHKRGEDNAHSTPPQTGSTDGRVYPFRTHPHHHRTHGKWESNRLSTER